VDQVQVEVVEARCCSEEANAFLVLSSPVSCTAENPHAGVQGLLDHHVRGIGHGGHLLLGDVVHRVASNEIRYRVIA
jgi:hypothetical protein